jgi:glycosyltransferase involved in cell wall biosynthesis
MSAPDRSSPRTQSDVPSIFSAQYELTDTDATSEWPIASSGRPYDQARLLVRVQGEPVGFATVPQRAQSLSRDAVLEAIESQLDGHVEAELRRQGLPRLRSLTVPFTSTATSRGLGPSDRFSKAVTVVICTRNRAEGLRTSLLSLQALEHEQLEFVIVDNAPTDSSTRELVVGIAGEDARFRYVCEPHRGLSWARNRGLSHALGEFIAYTDDDVRVDPLWVRGLLRGFDRRSDVACVTGLVASASLERPVEQYFDARVWWSSSCEPAIYDARHGPMGNGLHPYAAGGFGTGANFAFHTPTLREIGGFDETLGAGSRCAGGEDLDIFVRLLRRGHAIAYEPAALVWHEHRADRTELNRQMHAYGKALSAYLFKYASSRRTAADVWRRLPHGLAHMAALGQRSGDAGSRAGLGRESLRAELSGVLVGPMAYRRERRLQTRQRRRTVAP